MCPKSLCLPSELQKGEELSRHPSLLNLPAQETVKVKKKKGKKEHKPFVSTQGRFPIGNSCVCLLDQLFIGNTVAFLLDKIQKIVNRRHYTIFGVWDHHPSLIDDFFLLRNTIGIGRADLFKASSLALNFAFRVQQIFNCASQCTHLNSQGLFVGIFRFLCFAGEAASRGIWLRHAI